MNLYISGPLSWQRQLLERCKYLPVGVTCTARWLDLRGDPQDVEFERRAWQICLEDISRSDVVLGLVSLDLRSPGVHFELGYAAGKGLPIILVGPHASPYFGWPSVSRVDTLDEGLAALALLLTEQPPAAGRGPSDRE